MQSVLITTKVVRSNPGDGEGYSIKHNVIKFLSDLRQVGGFLRVLLFPPPIHDISEIVESDVKHHKPLIQFPPIKKAKTFVELFFFIVISKVVCYVGRNVNRPFYFSYLILVIF